MTQRITCQDGAVVVKRSEGWTDCILLALDVQATKSLHVVGLTPAEARRVAAALLAIAEDEDAKQRRGAV